MEVEMDEDRTVHTFLDVDEDVVRREKVKRDER